MLIDQHDYWPGKPAQEGNTMDDENAKALLDLQRASFEADQRRHEKNSARFRMTVIIILGIVAIRLLLVFVSQQP